MDGTMSLKKKEFSLMSIKAICSIMNEFNR